MENPLDGPAAPAPPGLQNNLIDPPSQRYLLVLTSVIFLACTTPMVAIRMYVNITTKFRWDDVLVLLSWLLFIAYLAVGIETGKYGDFVDIWNVRLGAVVQWLRLIYVEELLYLITLFLAKVSVLILYKRIFVPKKTRNRVYHAIIGVIVFNAIYYITTTVLEGLICVPRAKFWDPQIPGHCLNQYAIIISGSSVNVISDFLIIVIPVAVVQGLQMSWKRKAEVYFIFGFGLLCFVSSIVRLVYSVLAEHDPNQTVALAKLGLWTEAEISSCLIASCVPMAPRLVRRIRQKTQTSQQTPQTKFQSSPRRLSPPKSASDSLWSKISMLGQNASHEEDPYLMTQPSIDTDQETASTAVNESQENITEVTNNMSNKKPQMRER